MNFKIIRFIFTIVLSILYLGVNAQDYRSEIGITGGLAYYLGDANNVIFNKSQPVGGLVFRYNFNPRLAAHFEGNFTSIRGDATINNTGVTFANQVNAFDVCGEFNFFDLEKKVYKPDSRGFSPYLFAGIGCINYNYLGTPQLNLSYPFGIGVKLKLGHRLNFSAQWAYRIMLSDQMEGKTELNNLNNLNGTNILNNDILSTFSLGLTYDIWKKSCECKNYKH